MKVDDLLTALEANDAALSRTAQLGVVNTMASPEKLAKIGTEQVPLIISRNRRRVADYVAWKASVPLFANADWLTALLAISEIVNMDLSGNGTFRSWPLLDRQHGGSAPIPPQSVWPSLVALDFCTAFESEAGDGVGWAEWTIGIGPLHPFSDGCGRTSRAFSALAGIVTGTGIPIHASRSDYYTAGSAGLTVFQEYLRGLPRL
jgi:hypothetical protein